MAEIDLSLSQKMIIDYALEAYKERDMAQRDRDEIECIQYLMRINKGKSRYGCAKLKEVPRCE